MAFKHLKKDFPIFKNYPDLVYLDSAATSLKPQVVLDKLLEYYSEYGANIHRGIYKIAEKATDEYELAREKTAKFIHADSPNEVIFTGGTTHSLNLLAYSLGEELKESDEVLVTIADHHSNFVPWQQIAKKSGATFVVSPDDTPTSLLERVTERTRILSLPLVSNVLGTVFPIKDIAKKAREMSPSIYIIVDAAQAVPHRAVDVGSLGADFIVFSSHKMCGPTGVGVLWGKGELLERISPFHYGGEMIESVRIEETTFKKIPYKFEAGTPPIAQVIGLGAAVDYLRTVGMKRVEKHERELVKYAHQELVREFGEKISIMGPAQREDRGGLLSFTFGTYHAHDIAQILDEENIAVRAGHHCAMPLHESLGLASSVRASFYLYNDESDVKELIKGLKKVENLLS